MDTTKAVESATEKAVKTALDKLPCPDKTNEETIVDLTDEPDEMETDGKKTATVETKKNPAITERTKVHIIMDAERLRIRNMHKIFSQCLTFSFTMGDRDKTNIRKIGDLKMIFPSTKAAVDGIRKMQHFLPLDEFVYPEAVAKELEPDLVLWEKNSHQRKIDEIKGRSLNVSNIPPDVTEELVKAIFPDCLKVVIPEAAEGINMGFAIVEFPSKGLVSKCIKLNLEENLKIGDFGVVLTRMNQPEKDNSNQNQGTPGKQGQQGHNFSGGNQAARRMNQQFKWNRNRRQNLFAGQILSGFQSNQQKRTDFMGPKINLQPQGQNLQGNQQKKEWTNRGQMGNKQPGQMMGNKRPGQMMGNKQPGQMMGNKRPGQMIGNKQPGQIMGNKRPGQMMGNKQPGQMMGNKQPGRMVGNKRLGQMMGNNQRGQMVGKKQAGQMMGNNQRGQMVGKKQPGQMIGNNQRGQMVGRKQPGQMMGNNQRDQMVGRKQPRQMMGNNQRGQMVGRKQPGQMIGNNQRGQMVGRKQPGQMMGNNQRGQMVGNNQRGQMVGNNQRGQMVGNNQRGQMVGRKQPGQMIGNNQRGQMVGRKQPGQMVGRKQPGQMVGNNQRGQMVGSDQRGEMGRNQSGQWGRNQNQNENDIFGQAQSNNKNIRRNRLKRKWSEDEMFQSPMGIVPYEMDYDHMGMVGTDYTGMQGGRPFSGGNEPSRNFDDIPALESLYQQNLKSPQSLNETFDSYNAFSNRQPSLMDNTYGQNLGGMNQNFDLDSQEGNYGQKNAPGGGAVNNILQKALSNALGKTQQQSMSSYDQYSRYGEHDEGQNVVDYGHGGYPGGKRTKTSWGAGTASKNDINPRNNGGGKNWNRSGANSQGQWENTRDEQQQSSYRSDSYEQSTSPYRNRQDYQERSKDDYFFGQDHPYRQDYLYGKDLPSISHWENAQNRDNRDLAGSYPYM